MVSKDIREALEVLEKKGLLEKVSKEINKDTELMPLVRWQYRGLDEDQRKAFLFDNVVDSKGKKYDINVAVSVLGASRKAHAAIMGVEESELRDFYVRGFKKLIDPKEVSKGDAPCKEEIYFEKDIANGHGLDKFPIPISTPGFDPSPYFTSPYWITKDPETGIQNIGTYRAMVKGNDKTGILSPPSQHIGIHLHKWTEIDKPMPAALVIGGPPTIGMGSICKIPYGVDEAAAAGGIQGEPIEVVKCETIDIMVPARAEIVFEGEITHDYIEPEAPFGEYTGYMGWRQENPIFKIKCITHRKNPIYQAFISQMPPSESSKIKGITGEAIYYKLLKEDCNIPSVVDVALPELSGSWNVCIIQMKKTNNSQPWQALHGVMALEPTVPKIAIVVDEDIDPHDLDSVVWALSFRMQPHLDVQTTTGRMSLLDPSSAPNDKPRSEIIYPKPRGTSGLLIDATRKWDFTPVSLPEKKYMENARAIWEELGLPEIKPRPPWHGYELGYWFDDNREEAELAVKGEWKKTMEKHAKNGKNQGCFMD